MQGGGRSGQLHLDRTRLPMTPPQLPFSLGFLSKQLVGQENKAQGRKLDPENKLGFLY